MAIKRVYRNVFKRVLNNLQVYKNIRAQNKYFVKGYFIENFVENLELELEKLCKFIGGWC